MWKALVASCLLFCNQTLVAEPVFNVLALGINGGLTDGNLSSYLVKSVNEENYVALDAGTLVQGLLKADLSNPSNLLISHIPVYLISHAHMDHYMGLVMAQPELRNNQIIMARQETMEALKKFIFNWSVWGNFGDEGEKPQLKYQHYQTMPLLEWSPLPNTQMQVKAFPLNHGNGFPSTAFLIDYHGDYLLYFGDTGADEIEHSDYMKTIWKEVSPLIQKKKLHAIFLECSFTNEQPDNKLFGHLKPDLFVHELQQLARSVNPSKPEDALKDLPIFITHVKPGVDSINSNETAEKILNEVQKGSDLNLNLILPQQGFQYDL